jgi:hypothetical protein
MEHKPHTQVDIAYYLGKSSLYQRRMGLDIMDLTSQNRAIITKWMWVAVMKKDQFLLLLIIIKLILLKIRVRTVKLQIYEWQRATASGSFHKNNSGAFRPNPAQVR